MNAVNPHDVAEKLCIEAENLGLDHPTESMISDRMLDVVCNVLNFPVETATSIDGCQDTTVMRMFNLLQLLSGPLAEHAALDLDHLGARHREWYRKVKLARKLIATCKPNP